MAQPLTHYGDLLVTGNGRFGSLTVPNNSVGDANFDVNNPLTTDKQYHRFEQVYSQKRGASIASDTGSVIHVAQKDGTLEAFWVGFAVDDSGWTGNATVDLKKNGTSVLGSPITLTTTDAPFGHQAAGIGTPGYVTGDVFEVVIVFTAGAGTPPQGLFAQARFSEKPS